MKGLTLWQLVEFDFEMIQKVYRRVGINILENKSIPIGKTDME